MERIKGAWGLPIVAATLLAACSDGGPAGSTGFRLLEIAPAPGASDVAVTASVTAEFSRPVDPASVQEGTFVVRREGGDRVPGTLEIGSGNTRLVFMPASGFANNTRYDATLSDEVQSVDGDRFPGRSWTFRTAPASVSIDDPTGDQFPVQASEGRVLPDIVAVSATQGDTALTVAVTFAEEIVPSQSSPNAIQLILELDVDQDPATGADPLIDDFRRPRADLSGLGVEFAVLVSPDGSALIVGFAGGLSGTRAFFDDRTVTVLVPYDLIGADDGNVNLALATGTPEEATDIAPDTGHVRLGSPGS